MISDADTYWYFYKVIGMWDLNMYDGGTGLYAVYIVDL